jgi:hypothetical protein
MMMIMHNVTAAWVLTGAEIKSVVCVKTKHKIVEN